MIVQAILPAVLAGLVLAPAQTSTDARAAFDRLRQIAGTWSFTAGAEHGRVSYEIVSNGTAILERVMNEEHGEAGMVSVIHLDGDRLVLQHYCGSGNQPRLVANGLTGDEIRFAFESAGNLASPSAGHIHGAVFRFPARGAFESTWTWREHGVDERSTRQHRR